MLLNLNWLINNVFVSRVLLTDQYLRKSSQIYYDFLYPPNISTPKDTFLFFSRSIWRILIFLRLGVKVYDRYMLGTCLRNIYRRLRSITIENKMNIKVYVYYLQKKIRAKRRRNRKNLDKQQHC